jgi:hypothetical protein
MGKRALEGERTLSKDIPNYQGTYTTSTNLWSFDNGWQSNGSQPGVLYYETYFDLTGYQLDDLTLMPIAATLQDPGLYMTNDTTPQMLEMNVISQERISPAQMLNAFSNNQAFSFPETTQDWNNITFGEWKLKLLSKEFDTSTLFGDMEVKNFGSGSPCVVQKLYIYRIFFYVPADGKLLTIPASRMVLSALITSEKDLVYMQRLRRNYELQGSIT